MNHENTSIYLVNKCMFNQVAYHGALIYLSILKLATLTFLLLSFILVSIQCENNVRKNKEPILLADREAPLGWVYLRINEDSTFEFESRGLERNGDIYSGIVKIKNDTLFFQYKDSIPRAGQIAVYNTTTVVYIDGQYPEALSIKLNGISK